MLAKFSHHWPDRKLGSVPSYQTWVRPWVVASKPKVLAVVYERSEETIAKACAIPVQFSHCWPDQDCSCYSCLSVC